MAFIAVVNIPKGTKSKIFRVSDIYASASGREVGRGNLKIHFPLQVSLTSSGEMQPVSPISGTFWPKLLDIASDCHEQNIKLSRWNNSDGLVLQATRDILAGQNLQLWFSEELMMSELGIPPYLSPFNIKSGNSYVCHECQEEFERPNMLKLHLALHCDRLSTDAIWSRLKLTRSSLSPLLINPSYLVNLSPSSNLSLTPADSPLFTTSPIPPATMKSSPLPPHNQIQVTTVSPCRSNNRRSTASSTPSSIIDVDAPVDVPLPHNNAEETTTNGRSLVVQDQHHHHARLEAIVSNMGKAKNGHVCLYCGKLYSRKYGLKIHIRTHTGYKPLRCKICNRPFGDPSNLNKHVRLHSDGSTPYRCELCSKVLVRRRDLDRHMRARHGSSMSSSLIGGRTTNNNNLLQECPSAVSLPTSTVTSSMMNNVRI